MSALRIFSRFAELLDVKITRAAVAWLRLNADGTVSQRTAAETLGDIGAYPAASISGASVSYAATAGTADEASYSNTAGTSAAVAFGETVHAVSMSYFEDAATFTFGTTAAAVLRTAAYCVGSQPAGTHAALTRVTHHYACTQAQYDALGANKDANTIYDIY